MKAREIFGYEVAYRLRSASTWAYAAFLFLVAGWMFLSTSEGAEGVMLNSPLRLIGAYARPGMFGILVSAALFGGAAVRDVQSGMWPLMFTTPVRRLEYLGGRFLGAMAVNALLLAAVPLGVLGTIQAFGGQMEDRIGPFSLSGHAQAYLFYLLPNMALAGAILFAIGALARQMVAVYLGAIGLLIGSVVAMNYAAGVQGTLGGALLDPFGLMSVEYVTRYWSVAERNARLVGLPAEVLVNRGLWLAIAGAVLGLLLARFRFAQPGTGGGWRQRVDAPAEGAEFAMPTAVERVAGREGVFGPGTSVRQAVAIARQLLSQVVVSRWFAVGMLACVVMPMLWGWNVGATVFDTSTWPVTFLIVEVVLGQRSTLLFIVLILLFIGELVWRERDVGAAPIADAAPVSDAAAVAGRALAMMAVIVLLQAAGMVGGLLIQALQGYYRFEPGLYAQGWFGLKLADYLLLAALAMTVHLVVNHRNLGHLLALAAIFLTFVAGPLLGVHHHLLVYGTDPGWTYSDMNGFGPFLTAVGWFKAYWASWAVLLLALAALVRARGAQQDMRSRLRAARTRLGGGMRATLGLAVAGIAGFGAFIFYNTNVLHEYVRPPEAGQRAAEYEKRYAQFATLPQPTIVDAALRIEIYPERLAAECSGSFGLVNRTGQPIGQIHVSTSRDAITRSLSLDRACVTEVQDDEVGYRIFRLEEPLPPGGTVRLAFSCEFSPRGFANSRHPTEVVANGAHFHRGMMPTVGYQPALEVAGNLERQRLGLSARPPAPGPDDQEARRERWALRDADLVHVDAVIGTAEDQIAVTPGELQGTWSENGRRYFHYRTRTPVAFGGTVFSARYAVREDRWNDVALQIFHHPGHEANLDRMMSAMKASLEYFTAEFGPYPYRQARIVEFPRYGGFGHAHPETIGFSEDAFLSRVMENEADQPFYGVAHEMAHTWWGGLVRGGRVRGAEFLSESLANYSAMMVVEQVYGREAARKVYGFQKERYLQGRADQGHEVPLLYVEDQPYIAYRKGAIVLYQLRERLGAEAVNAALRRYLEKFVDAGPPYPSSLDLYAELRGAVPAELHSWLADLFEAITLWDVATAGASATRNEAGGYDVTIEVVAEKVRADVNGAETPAKVNEWIDVGLFAAGEGGALGEALYLQPHRIRGGRQTVRVTIGAAPAYAGVDPYRMVIERNGADNVVAVAVRGGETVGW